MTPMLVILILCVAGLLVYALAANTKAQEIGRLMFACAFLALCVDIGRVLGLLR